jgi:RecA/RadA recombinase
MSKDTQMQTSDFNLQKITTVNLENIVDSAIQSGSNVAVFGRRGSGKTQICKQRIAKATITTEVNGVKVVKKVREVYLNLSVVERTDMGGYPDMFSAAKASEEKRQRFVEYILPEFFRKLMEDDEPVVVLFDEADKADPSVIAPLLEIVQFHTINGKQLTNLQCCLLTGNLISEGSQRPSLPLLDRAEKYLLEPDVQSWLDWAGKSGRIHPTVTAFIYDKNTELYGSTDNNDNYADPSPRGWELTSAQLAFGEKAGWDPDLLRLKVSGFVGKKAGLDFQIYYDHYQVLLPLVEKVFEGKNINKEFNKLDPSKQFIVAMVVCSRLSNHLDSAWTEFRKTHEKGIPPFPKSLAIVGKFLTSIDQEKAFVAIRTQVQRQRMMDWDLVEAPVWKDIINDILTSLKGT